jgi:hypothetical protein
MPIVRREGEMIRKHKWESCRAARGWFRDQIISTFRANHLMV